jgi:hypothetical protein
MARGPSIGAMKPSLAIALSLLLAGCATPAPRAPDTTPADRFFAQLQALCGRAFAGRVVVDTPAAATSPFAGKALVMHVRRCAPDRIEIPFHVGDDRSRTWVVTRTGSGLRLKHDHRHADGSHDAVTMYGGDTVAAGTDVRQAFPLDAQTTALFTKEGLPASLTNTWALEIEPGQRFVYELSRPGGRLFRVEFDLAAPVPVPPAPWGHE